MPVQDLSIAHTHTKQFFSLISLNHKFPTNPTLSLTLTLHLNLTVTNHSSTFLLPTNALNTFYYLISRKHKDRNFPAKIRPVLTLILTVPLQHLSITQKHTKHLRLPYLPEPHKNRIIPKFSAKIRPTLTIGLTIGLWLLDLSSTNKHTKQLQPNYLSLNTKQITNS
jgi:hypothetical protein